MRQFQMNMGIDESGHDGNRPQVAANAIPSHLFPGSHGKDAPLPDQDSSIPDLGTLRVHGQNALGTKRFRHAWVPGVLNDT